MSDYNLNLIKLAARDMYTWLTRYTPNHEDVKLEWSLHGYTIKITPEMYLSGHERVVRWYVTVLSAKGFTEAVYSGDNS